MALIHPITVSERFPIGSILELTNPPNDNWILCNGQILTQADYFTLYNLIDDPHPIFQHMEERAKTPWHAIYEIAYGNSRWVGCGESGTMHYSTDGETWVDVALAAYTEDYRGIAYDGTTFVSFPDSSSPLMEYITSTDGMSWTERTMGVSLEAHAVAYDGTNFYVVDYNGINCLYSANGTSWTAGTNLPDYSWHGLAASANVVVTTAYSGQLAVSTDAMTTWKLYPMIKSLKEIEYNSDDDLFVAASGIGGCYGVSAGDDGVDWEFRWLPISESGQEASKYYDITNTYRIRKAGS